MTLISVWRSKKPGWNCVVMLMGMAVFSIAAVAVGENAKVVILMTFAAVGAASIAIW